jgi:hypothetical protein
VPGSADVRVGGRPPRAGTLRPAEAGCRGRWRWSRGGSCLVRSILLDPLGAGAAHAGSASAADLWAAAVMLVIGGDVPDRGVQADGVVLGADTSELGIEGGGVGDLGEVRPVTLQ